MSLNVNENVMLTVKKAAVIPSHVELEIKDGRLFQAIALCVDREDFRQDLVAKRQALGLPESLAILTQEQIFQAANDLRRKYGYPQDFMDTFVAVLVLNAVTSYDMRHVTQTLQSPSYQDTMFKDYGFANHPLFFRYDKHIKRDRQWFWEFHILGYRRLAKKHHQELTTVQTAITSYRQKISFPLSYYRL